MNGNDIGGGMDSIGSRDSDNNNNNHNDYHHDPITPPGPSLADQHEKAMSEAETRRLEAEAELEKSKTEFLEAQIGKVDPSKIALADIMPGEKDKASAWLLIGAALLFSFKFLK